MTKLHWRRSTRSGGNGNCVEAAAANENVAVRDSKVSTGTEFPMLTVTQTEWAGLTKAVRSGKLDV